MTDRERVRILRAALQAAALHFRAYEALHREKGIQEAMNSPGWNARVEKAKTNRERAIACERALQDTV